MIAGVLFFWLPPLPHVVFRSARVSYSNIERPRSQILALWYNKIKSKQMTVRKTRV